MHPSFILLKKNSNDKKKKLKKINSKDKSKSLFSNKKNINKNNNIQNENQERKNNLKLKKEKKIKFENDSGSKSKKKSKVKLSLFSPELIRRNSKRSKTNKEKENLKKNIVLSLFKTNNDEIFVKAEKINQNAEDDIFINDFDIDFDEEINNNNKTFDSTKIMNSDEDKDTNFISNKNENEYKKRTNYNIPRKINIVKINRYDDYDDDNDEPLTYREKNKYNLFNNKKNDEEINNLMLNTSREHLNNDHDEIYSKINKNLKGIIIYNPHLKKKNRIPGDFIPKIDTKDKENYHVQLIPSNEVDTKILIHTLDNSFNKSFNDQMNKSFIQLKPTTLLDNPKYVYLEDNYNNVKIHKSNLLNNKKSKK